MLTTWNSRGQRLVAFGLLLSTSVTCEVTDYTSVNVGDQICFEGFVMDNYCIELGTLLDERSSRTLERPDRHSVHCLIDVFPCRNSNFELLAAPPEGSIMYSRAFQFTDEGKEGIIAVASAVGAKQPQGSLVCKECTGEGSLGRGFRAEVYGIVTAAALDDGTPATVHIVDATATHDRQGAPSCTGTFPTEQNLKFGEPLVVRTIVTDPTVEQSTVDPVLVAPMVPAPVLPAPVLPAPVVPAPAPVDTGSEGGAAAPGPTPTDTASEGGIVVPAPMVPAVVPAPVVPTQAPADTVSEGGVVAPGPAPADTTPAVVPAPMVPAPADTMSEGDVPMGLANPSTVSVGDNVCFEGFVMDYFCIERGTLLDNSRVQTLIGPEQHSVHCLIDIRSCRNSNFELLGAPPEGSNMYTRAFQFDGASKEGIISLAAAVGDTRGCRTCTAESGNLSKGFRAEVYGVVTELTDPPTIEIVDAVASNDMEGNPCMRTSMPEPSPLFEESEEKSGSGGNTGNMNATEIAFMTLAFVGVGALGVVSVFGKVLFPKSKAKAPAAAEPTPEEASLQPKPTGDPNTMEALTY